MVDNKDFNLVTKMQTCAKCGREFPLTSKFWYVDKTKPSGFRGKCKQCLLEYVQDYRSKNKEKMDQYQQQWYKDNKEKILKRSRERHRDREEIERGQLLKRRYGMSLDDYEQILQQQNGQCPICGKSSDKQGKRLSVEHNHRTGFVRGLTCNFCNRRRIGPLGDNKNVWIGMRDYIDNALEKDTSWK